MDLELVELRRNPGAGSYEQSPFDDDDVNGFEPTWWIKRWDEGFWFIRVIRGLNEVARVELEQCNGAEYARGDLRRMSMIIEISFIEVAAQWRCKGIGTAVVRALETRYSHQTLVAFSEDADGFWSSLGWTAFAADDPSANRTLFVHRPS